MLSDYEKYLLKRYVEMRRSSDKKGCMNLKIQCKDLGMRDLVKQMNQVDDSDNP